MQATRSDDEAPETVLRQVIAALCEIEKTAFARSQAAAKHRSARHQLCPEDAAAEIATNRDYLDLLMTWATPGRAPTMGSYSGHPERDPSKMGQINPEASISDEASFIVTFSKLPTSYCYVLRRLSLLTQPPLWRLDQIIAMMDGETFRVF